MTLESACQVNSSESTANQAQIGVISSKSMQGKYDGRKKNGATKERRRFNPNYERKPLGAKNLTRNTAAQLFKQCDLKVKLIELLASPDARLRFEVIRYVWDRLEGKPFVAENPNAKPQANNILNDNRLQIAIQQLVPAKQQRKSKKTQAIQAVSDVKQLTPGEPTQQTYVDADTQVVDSTQDQAK